VSRDVPSIPEPPLPNPPRDGRGSAVNAGGSGVNVSWDDPAPSIAPLAVLSILNPEPEDATGVNAGGSGVNTEGSGGDVSKDVSWDDPAPSNASLAARCRSSSANVRPSSSASAAALRAS